MQSVKVIKKIDDIPELKEILITISESKTHKQMSQYSLLLAKHILEISEVECCSAIAECFDINKKWQNGEAKFQDARQVAFMVNRLAREEKDPVKVKVLRAMGQVAATPHVKWHALVASEYAITLINVMYPKNLEEVKKEREIQIELMKSV
ncbi:hypothetical protein DCMF_02155 [Candidatus Formimonas warabiya]|uniref:Imm-5-like domain-containing protein n=2 Tax=Formimonas warabiya TaxID=1761012 RepID=A0A3G1L0J2_FORW1|nr:hypothetical protein DCMF_02155 [Candidatus Formimonas warabiya]